MLPSLAGNKTMTKRKLPPSAYADKQCKWCGKTLVRTYQPLCEWNLISTCGKGCATSWRWHKCSKEELPDAPVRHCIYCEKLLVRREGEKRTAWLKRLYCGKSCSAIGKKPQKQYITPLELPEDAIRMGVTRYVPGTEEFNRVASYYMARGF